MKDCILQVLLLCLFIGGIHNMRMRSRGRNKTEFITKDEVAHENMKDLCNGRHCHWKCRDRAHAKDCSCNCDYHQRFINVFVPQSCTITRELHCKRFCYKEICKRVCFNRRVEKCRRLA